MSATPRSVVARDGSASLLRFFDGRGGEAGAAEPAGGTGARVPILLVPSLINRWYVLDLRPGASLVEALVARGHDVFCLDWGGAEDEDRHLEWDDLVARLGRMARRVRRVTGARKIALVGYCMGATLAAIHAALEPSTVASLVDLAGPIDFSHAGLLGEMVDPRWFDARAVGAAGNVSPLHMQSGFVALRPTLQISKWVGFLDRAHDGAAVDAFVSLETWASDSVAFPGAAYVTYIEELYQQNLLVAGKHHVAGRRVDLGAIECPVLAIVADRDTICPAAAATALLERTKPDARNEVLSIPGGHVGAVVGKRAQKELFPAMSRWLEHATAA